jgi:hypothetical protein
MTQQELAERAAIKRQLAVSAWNRGEDPSQVERRKVVAGLAPGGYSTASVDYGKLQPSVDSYSGRQAPSFLPDSMRRNFEAERDGMQAKLNQRRGEQREALGLSGYTAPYQPGDVSRPRETTFEGNSQKFQSLGPPPKTNVTRARAAYTMGSSPAASPAAAPVTPAPAPAVEAAAIPKTGGVASTAEGGKSDEEWAKLFKYYTHSTYNPKSPGDVASMQMMQGKLSTPDYVKKTNAANDPTMNSSQARRYRNELRKR